MAVSLIARLALTALFGQALGQSCKAATSPSDTCLTKPSPREARVGQQLLQWKDDTFVSRTPQDFYSPAYVASPPHSGVGPAFGSHAPSAAEAALAELSQRLEQFERREDASAELSNRFRLGSGDSSNHDEVRLAAVEARIASMEGGLHAAEDKLQELITTAQVHSSSKPEVSQAALAPMLEAFVQAVSSVRTTGVDLNQLEMSKVESELASLESRMNRASSPHEVEARIDGLEQRLDLLLGAFGHDSNSGLGRAPFQANTRPSTMPQPPVYQPPANSFAREAAARNMMAMPNAPPGGAPSVAASPAWAGFGSYNAAAPPAVTAESGEEITPDQLRRMGYPGVLSMPVA